jgi:hypothetical protein
MILGSTGDIRTERMRPGYWPEMPEKKPLTPKRKRERVRES